jgi:hypothetical protein
MSGLGKFLVFFLTLYSPLTPVATAATNAVKSAEVDYADVTGPKLESVKVDKTTLNLKSKSVVVKIIVTVSDDLNSVDNPGVFFSRLDSEGKITGPKLMPSKPKPSKRISSTVVDGRRIEVFEMTSTFPKGLAKGSYRLMTGDFRDLASNRRQDLSDFNGSTDSLPVVTVR